VRDTSPSKYISITNNATNDGYSEGLKASFGSALTGFSTTGTISNLTAGGTNENTLQVSLGTSTAGSFGGSQALNLWSTGSGTSNILADQQLTGQNVAVSGVVNNWAKPVFGNLVGPLGSTLTGGGNLYTLNLGNLTQGLGTVSASLSLTNNAAAPADWLKEKWSYTLPSGVTLSGFTDFSNLLAGEGQKALGVELSTANAGGDFIYSIVLKGISGNVNSEAFLPSDVTLSLKGTVNAAPVPLPSAVWLLGAGLIGLVGVRRRFVK
jgi:hypothetical protein